MTPLWAIKSVFSSPFPPIHRYIFHFRSVSGQSPVSFREVFRIVSFINVQRINCSREIISCRDFKSKRIQNHVGIWSSKAQGQALYSRLCIHWQVNYLFRHMTSGKRLKLKNWKFPMKKYGMKDHKYALNIGEWHYWITLHVE